MKTEQQAFWKGNFGTEYISRNDSAEFLAANIHLFSNIFSRISKSPNNLLELGANIGMNLKACKLLFPNCHFTGVEINKVACDQLSEEIDEAINTSIENFKVVKQYDIVLLKGVLIHIAPENLALVYEKIFDSSSRYILLIEYFNPTPVAIPYRGHEDKLFKRDFAGEMLSIYPNLELAACGFSYRNSIFPQDDVNWFLLEKMN